MVGEIMRRINNFFVKSSEEATVSFSCLPSTITFDAEPVNYKIGQYIKVENSILNNGVYKIVSKAGNNLILEEDIFDEEDVLITILSLAPPRDFLAICEKLTEQGSSYPGDVSEIKTGDTTIKYNADTEKLLAPYRRVWFK